MLTILPLIKLKFPAAAKILEDATYAVELRAALHECEQFKEQLRQRSLEIVNARERVEQLEGALSQRIKYCRFECGYTQERVREEWQRTLQERMEDIGAHARLLQCSEDERHLRHREWLLSGILKVCSAVQWLDHSGLLTEGHRSLFKDFEEKFLSSFAIDTKGLDKKKFDAKTIKRRIEEARRRLINQKSQ